MVTYIHPALDASLPVFIRIAKERIICRNCQTNSMAQTELVDKYCCISNATKRKIIGSLTEDWSMKSIARQTSTRSEEHTSELQSRFDLVCRLLLEKKNITMK